MQHVPSGGGDVLALAHQLGHFETHRHRLVRRTGQVQRDLHRHPAPELALQGQVERRDHADPTLRQWAFEGREVQAHPPGKTSCESSVTHAPGSILGLLTTIRSTIRSVHSRNGRDTRSTRTRYEGAALVAATSGRPSIASVSAMDRSYCGS